MRAVFDEGVQVAEPTDLQFVKGAAASRAVAADPFWSTVVRRHGEVDVVVLPPGDSAPPPPIPPDEPVVDAAAQRERLRQQMAQLWSALELADEASRLDDVWFAGSLPGTLRWQGTASFEDLDPVAASSVLERARDLFAPSAAGWHTVAPEDGIPRVLAGRPGRWAREEVQVLLPSASRIVIRVRADLVHVGQAAADRVLGGEP